MTIGDVLGYRLPGQYPREATRAAHPSPCVCRPNLGIPRATAYVSRTKQGYPQLQGPTKRFLTKTVKTTWRCKEHSISFNGDGAGNAEVKIEWTYNYGGTSTLVSKVDPVTGKEDQLVAWSGNADFYEQEAHTDLTGSHPTWTWEVTRTDSSTAIIPGPPWPRQAAWTITGTYADGEPYNPLGWGGDPYTRSLYGSSHWYNRPDWYLWDWRNHDEKIEAGEDESGGATQTKTETWSVMPTPADDGSTWEVVTTLSDEFTDAMLDEQVGDLLAAAEAKITKIWWYPGYAPGGNFRVAAEYKTIPEPAAQAAVDAAQAEVGAKQAALDAIDPANTYDGHVAKNRLEFAKLGLEIAQLNQTHVGNSTNPIVLTLTEEDDNTEAEAFCEAPDDGWSLTRCLLFFQLGASVASGWDYATKPVRHEFRWRQAAYSQSTSVPEFSEGTAFASNAVALSQVYPWGYTAKWAFAVQDSMLSIPAPTAPRRITLINPNKKGTTAPEPYVVRWNDSQNRNAVMHKVGFAAYLPPDGVPVIYRRETASDSGYQEFKLVEYFNEEEGDPTTPTGSAYEYDNSTLPEDFDYSKLSPSAPGGPLAQHLCHYPDSGTIKSSTVREFKIGDAKLTVTLSNPWTTEEMQSAVNANIDAPWTEAPDYIQPPFYPDTGAYAALRYDSPCAARLLSSLETYYLRARSRYRSNFALPGSAGKNPAIENGLSINWTWKRMTQDLQTGEVAEEQVTESIAYEPFRTDRSEDWRELPSPENGILVWITKPETTDPWCWGPPECRPVCDS